MRFVAGLSQLGAVKAPNRPAANDRDLHRKEGNNRRTTAGNAGRMERQEDGGPGYKPIIPSSRNSSVSPLPPRLSRLSLHPAPDKSARAYLAPRMASLAALATRNFTTRLAGIWICSPVAGLRPRRAARLTNTSLPNPGSVKVFLACLYANWQMLSRTSTACFLVKAFFSAIAAAICDFESALAIVLVCLLLFGF